MNNRITKFRSNYLLSERELGGHPKCPQQNRARAIENGKDETSPNQSMKLG